MSSQVTGWVAPNSVALFSVFFLSGYYGRNWIDQITESVRHAPLISSCILMLWAILHSYALHDGLTAIPGFTILFGQFGALATVALAVLVSRAKIMGWLAYCGRHSLAIYLAFVIPMGVSRSLLVNRLGVTQPDIVMVTVLACAIVFPLIFERLVQTGPLRLLFVRPGWARLTENKF